MGVGIPRCANHARLFKIRVPPVRAWRALRSGVLRCAGVRKHVLRHSDQLDECRLVQSSRAADRQSRPAVDERHGDLIPGRTSSTRRAGAKRPPHRELDRYAGLSIENTLEGFDEWLSSLTDRYTLSRLHFQEQDCSRICFFPR
jgi:hypothetical protein